MLRKEPVMLLAGTEWALPLGDYDGDGYSDLYVTQYGESILYHNNGDGRFTDVTKGGRCGARMGFERPIV
jgi:hypothetical protein